ncbi:MAG: sulfatase-like hydrolase/transferase [Vicinamibacterales bacterium]
MACARDPAPPAAAAPTATPRSVLLVTIDTLRADHVGAYGHAAAHTPTIDRLAAGGTRYTRAYATAPITLTSHASLLTGRYPPGHGARHNGIRLDLKTPTLAEAFSRAGFDTAAFVAAFPLDRRFGLIKGFRTYGDVMPRDSAGRPANERPGQAVVDEAIGWLSTRRAQRFFLWVHLFEPHSPYGTPATGARTAIERYDDDIAEADRQVGRLLEALRETRAQTVVVLTADHGEAFGEHGEISHSLFTYDTTLRVPLILAGPDVGTAVVSDAVSLVDVAPTIAALAGLGRFDGDGRTLPASSLQPGDSSVRALYAESFAPLLDFGWSPLRTVRSSNWKYIAAPKPELYDVSRDPGETRNLAAAEPSRAAELARQVEALSPDLLEPPAGTPDPESLARLQALGYASGRRGATADLADPKDRRQIAARFAQVASGELRGRALERALRDIVRADPANPQGNLRLGYVLLDSGRCREAVPRFSAAIAAHLPSAEAHLGRAACETAGKDAAAAERTLTAAQDIEPDNPLVSANLGLLLSDTGRPAAGIPHLQRALSLDPDLHQARFGLAIAYARTGRRPESAKEARELLGRLPKDAPQRSEVERLLAAVK